MRSCFFGVMIHFYEQQQKLHLPNKFVNTEVKTEYDIFPPEEYPPHHEHHRWYKYGWEACKAQTMVINHVAVQILCHFPRSFKRTRKTTTTTKNRSK